MPIIVLGKNLKKSLNISYGPYFVPFEIISFQSNFKNLTWKQKSLQNSSFERFQNNCSLESSFASNSFHSTIRLCPILNYKLQMLFVVT